MLYLFDIDSNCLQWATTEPEFNEQFVFITNIVDLPKQVGRTFFLYLNNDCDTFAIFTEDSSVTDCKIDFQSLAVTVWHQDKLKQNDYLGGR